LVRLSQAESALAEAQANLEVLSARILGLRQSLEQATAKETRGVPEIQDNQKDGTLAAPAAADALVRINAFKVAQDRLTKLEARLAAMRERYTEAHPLVQSTQLQVMSEQARIAQLARELPPLVREPVGPPAPAPMPSDRLEAHRQLAALETEESSLQSKVEALKIQVGRLRNGLRNLTQEEVEFSNLRRTVEANRNLLTVISDKLMAAQIREQGDTGVVRIIDPASFPVHPSQSKTQKLAVMILAFSGGLAFIVAFGIEFWREPIETESDVSKITNLPVIGFVSMIKSAPFTGETERDSQSSRLPLNLRGSPGPATIDLELYRAIRANVETERLKSPFCSILVTSPTPGEGKSTTVLNLAQVFQEFGRRVLVIEADLRRPMLCRTLALANRPSLADFLNGSSTFNQICRKLPSGIVFIPGQVLRGDPASALASFRLKELLRQASAQFDLILVDSPPVLAVPDNLLLVTAIDRVILVVKASSTSKRELRKTQAVLQRANAKILGLVLNQAHRRDIDYYHRRYRKYYGSTDGKHSPEPSRKLGLLSSKEKR
jgi:tyrosine-protein kinase Etk/Wzc